MKIKIVTLGCAKNEVDSEYLATLLEQGGHQLVAEVEQAQAVLVNTCGFIQAAKEEALDVLFELIELKKQGKIQKIIAAGCLVERYLAEFKVELSEVDVFLPFAAYSRLNEALTGEIKQPPQAGFLPSAQMIRTSLTKQAYSYLKISEGCDNNCTYCAIPLIRGKLRSRPVADILAEARSLAASGSQELIILGQDTTSFGRDISPRQSLTPLLRQLLALGLFPWIRLMYAHPAHLNNELIALLAEDNALLPYLDLPLQHINDRILKKMNRRIDKKQIIQLLRSLRAQIPGLVIRTTFIVGFPGETTAEFQELLDFIRESKFERLGAFTYSQEEGTPAYRFQGQLDEEVKLARFDELMQAQQEIAAAFQQTLVSKTLPVLLEDYDPLSQRYVGRTYADAPEVDGVISVSGTALTVGSIVPVKVTAASIYDLTGESDA